MRRDLKVRGLQLGDALIPTGVVSDELRGVACTPLLAADGTMRCLPSNGTRSIWFSDDACTHPIIVDQGVDACTATEPPPYVSYEVSLRGPPSGRTMYGVGAAISPPAQAYAQTPLGCNPVDGGTATFYDVVPSPPDDWVRVRHAVTKVTDRLGVAYWDGTDGSRILDGLRLLPEDIPCSETTPDGNGASPSMDPQAVAPCTPSNALGVRASLNLGGVGLTFADASCAKPVPMAITFACKPPDVLWGPAVYPAVDGAAPACGAPNSFASGVAPLYRPVSVPSNDVYVQALGPADAGACGITPYGGFRHYSAGAPLRFEDYPVVASGHSGSGRFQPVEISSEGKVLYTPSGVLYDTRARELCFVDDTLRDGSSFCVGPFDFPSYLFIAQASDPFADPACKTPLARVEGDCPRAAPVAVQEEYMAGSCRATRLRRITGVHAAPTYSTRSGACAPSQDLSGRNYDVGDVVDPAALFPLLTSVDL